jgi:N-terminal acetyltransferase B complex non-catalytic subunit
MSPPRADSTPSSASLISRPVPASEAERRLRPVLDVLYHGDNPRQALKIATQAEGKRPGWPAARALRALALLRLGKGEEAQELAERILNDLEQGLVPADEDAAAKLHLFYRELPHREYLSARAYEIVARKNETISDLSETSFMYHIRARDFSMAQKIATRLQRTAPVVSISLSSQRPREEYAIWAVASLWLSNRGPGMNTKLNALVPALLKRALRGIPVPTAEVARFATRLFCDTGDYDAAGDLLSTENIVMDASELAHLRADVFFQANNSVKATESYRVMLAEGDSEDWGHWLRYISLAPHADVIGLLDSLSNGTGEAGAPSRGQLLALMEVLFRQRDFAALRSAIVNYFKHCGFKSVCALDLKPYALAFATRENGERDVDACESLCHDLEESMKATSSDETDEKSSQRHITISWLRLWLNCLTESPERLFGRYQSLIVDCLESTDRQPGDDYLILAAHRLLPNTKSERYENGPAIIRAILVIEAGLAQSPFNFHFKLLLIRLYTTIGAVGRAFDLWSTLDVKHIQIATLGHLVVRPVFHLGFFTQWTELAAVFRILWLECERDIPESVSRAFFEGSINAAVEFIEFRSNLERSAISVDVLLCDALQCICSGLEDAGALEAAWNTLGDYCRLSPAWLVPPCKLFKSDDRTVMEFWDLDSYCPDRCRVDMDSALSDSSDDVSSVEQWSMLAKFIVTRCFIRILRGTGLSSGKDTAHGDASVSTPSFDLGIESDLSLLKEGTKEVGEAGKSNAQVQYLVTLLHNVTSIYRYTLDPSDDSDVNNRETADVTYLEDTSFQLKSKSIDIGRGKRCLSPFSLGDTGKYVHETLTLTAMAVKSLSKISLNRPPPTSTPTTLTKWRRAKAVARLVTERYAKSAGTACQTILDLIAPVVDMADEKSDWTRTWVGIQPNFAGSEHLLVAFLPETLPCPDAESSTCDEETLTREEFHETVIDAVSVSHIQSCSNILKSLNSISHTFKLAAV